MQPGLILPPARPLWHPGLIRPRRPPIVAQPLRYDSFQGGGGQAPGGGGGPVLAFLQGYTNATDTSVYTQPAVGLGDPAAGRVIILTTTWGYSFLAETITGVTIGGVSAALAIRATATSVKNADIWYAAVPTGATGDVVITYSASGANRRTLALYRVTGLTSLTPAGTANVAGAGAMALDVSTGGIALAVMCRASATADTFPTLDHDHGASAGSVHYGVHASSSPMTTETLSINTASPTSGDRKCAASWA